MKDYTTIYVLLDNENKLKFDGLKEKLNALYKYFPPKTDGLLGALILMNSKNITQSFICNILSMNRVTLNDRINRLKSRQEEPIWKYVELLSSELNDIEFIT